MFLIYYSWGKQSDLSQRNTTASSSTYSATMLSVVIPATTFGWGRTGSPYLPQAEVIWKEKKTPDSNSCIHASVTQSLDRVYMRVWRKIMLPWNVCRLFTCFTSISRFETEIARLFPFTGLEQLGDGLGIHRNTTWHVWNFIQNRRNCKTLWCFL